MDTDQYCNNRANQILILSAIYSGIITQEIPDDDLLGILGDLLQAIGTNLSLTADVRANCKSNLNPSSDKNSSSSSNISDNDSSTQLVGKNIITDSDYIYPSTTRHVSKKRKSPVKNKNTQKSNKKVKKKHKKVVPK